MSQVYPSIALSMHNTAKFVLSFPSSNHLRPFSWTNLLCMHLSAVLKAAWQNRSSGIQFPSPARFAIEFGLSESQCSFPWVPVWTLETFIVHIFACCSKPKCLHILERTTKHCSEANRRCAQTEQLQQIPASVSISMIYSLNCVYEYLPYITTHFDTHFTPNMLLQMTATSLAEESAAMREWVRRAEESVNGVPNVLPR